MTWAYIFPGCGQPRLVFGHSTNSAPKMAIFSTATPKRSAKSSLAKAIAVSEPAGTAAGVGINAVGVAVAGGTVAGSTSSALGVAGRVVVDS